MRMQFFEVTDLGSAWLAGFSSLLETGHSAVTLSITDPLREDLGVRREIEQTLVDLKASGNRDFRNVQSMDTVASTIFPIDLYPGRGYAEHFFDEVDLSEDLRSHSTRRGWGTYIGRLTRFPSPSGQPVNQLREALRRLQLARAWSSVVEMPVETPYEDLSLNILSDGETDWRLWGGPCLAYVSVTRIGDRLSMLAQYRHHYYYMRAYGNFLGLARLLAFLAGESSLEVGELTVTTGHAEADGTHRREFFDRATAAAGSLWAVEVASRDIDADYSDLDLPRRSR